MDSVEGLSADLECSHVVEKLTGGVVRKARFNEPFE